MATQAQVGRLRALIREADMDFETALDLAEEITGSCVTKLEELSNDEASTLIDRLQNDGRI